LVSAAPPPASDASGGTLQHGVRRREAHILIGHILCELVEQELFPRAAERREAAAEVSRVAVAQEE